MEEVDILDRQIKGVTIKMIGALISSVGTIVVFGMLLYSGITDSIKDSEARLTETIKDVQYKQELRDTIQNRDILEIKGKLASVIIK